MSTVLLTAFEPFDGQVVNASLEAARRVEAAWDGPGALVVRVLPVSFRRARQELRAAVAELEPDVVVCTGEAGGRAAVGIERVAVNVIDARIPDADGSAPVDVPVIAGAPAAFFSTLPVKACWAAARAAGAPAEVSGSAGTYVCNATFYALQHLLHGRGAARSGFVHVPRLPEQVAAGEPSLAADVAARGLLAAVRAAVTTSTDVRVAAGSLD